MTISETSRHAFESEYGVPPRAQLCCAYVDGRRCMRPDYHWLHRPDGPDGECSVCTTGEGTWMLCTCTSRCGEKLCRHSNGDIFDHRKVPVPKFRLKNGKLKTRPITEEN